MKRFLSLLMLFTLAIASAVPCYASSVTNEELKPSFIALGFTEESLSEMEYWTLAIIQGDDGEYVRAYLTHEPFIVKTSGAGTRVYWTNNQLTYFAHGKLPEDGVPLLEVKKGGYGGDAFAFAVDKVISIVTNYDIVDTEACDGSDCSAWDANFNGLCDECGFQLMNLTRSPVPPTVDVPNKGWVTLYDGSTYKYHVFYADYTYSLRGSVYGSSYRVDADPAVNVIEYESHDGINWTDGTTRTGLTSHFPGLASQTILSSTFNWYTEEGDHFFPETLWGEMAKVTQGEMANLTGEMVGTMKVLVPCGVGLMALLVVLSLFGKRSLISLR